MMLRANAAKCPRVPSAARRIPRYPFVTLMSKTNTAKQTEVSTAPKLAYTRDEAAAQLGVHPITISRLTERGELRANRATRRPLYSHDELVRFLNKTAPKPAKS